MDGTKVQNYAGHAALFFANLIYAANYTIAKEVMPGYIPPLAFILLRVSTALLLFWALHLLTAYEKVAKKDLVRLCLCGLFGVAINQLFFFKGLNITTPINASVMMLSNPIMVLVFSAMLLGLKITYRKIIGIGLGSIGAATLILFGEGFTLGSDTLIGDVLVLINSTSYAFYLVLVKPLMNKYKPLTIIKWTFTFGILFVAPVSFHELKEIEWSSIPTSIWIGIVYVLLFTTFLAYLLNIIGLKKLSPTVVSSYIYLQPLLATVIAYLAGRETVSIHQILSFLLIFSGVFIISQGSISKKNP